MTPLPSNPVPLLTLHTLTRQAIDTWEPLRSQVRSLTRPNPIDAALGLDNGIARLTLDKLTDAVTRGLPSY